MKMENKVEEIDAKRSNLIDSLFLGLCKKLKNFDKLLNFSFMQLSTNFERFKFVYSIPNVQTQLFDSVFSTTYHVCKNDCESAEFRRQGNDAFRSKRFYDALLKYNEAIRFADPHAQVARHEKEEKEVCNELALAYANRSAVFFHLGEFGLCLNDLEQALANGYPTRLRPRLIERKLNCLYNMEKYDKLLRFIESETSEPNLIKHFEAKLAQLKLEEQKEKELNNLENDSFEHDFYFKSYANISFELEKKNAKIGETASHALSIDHALDKGFFLRAERDIQIGELLVNERPYAGVLLGENFDSHCFECMLKLDPLRMNLTFCAQCATIKYCSVECEKRAWSTHHKFECKYIRLLAFESGLTHMEWLALRVILKASNEHLLSMKYDLETYEKKYESLMNRLDSTPHGSTFHQKVFTKYDSESYLSIFNLITNSHLRRLNDLFRRSFVALFFVKFLHKTNFINEKLDGERNAHENSVFVGGLLLRHLQSISCNAHEISRLKMVDNCPSSKQPMAHSFANGIGAGIYAVLSLFNHSCDPHVTRNFRGALCQVRALRSIGKNEQIFDNYGVLYAVNDLDERREKLLDQYFFECRCSACEENWPPYDKIPHELNSKLVKCEACRKLDKRAIDCIKCLSDLDTLNLLQLNAQQSLRTLLRFTSHTNLSNENVEQCVQEIYENYAKYLCALTAHKIKRPFQDYNNFEEALKQLLNFINIK